MASNRVRAASWMVLASVFFTVMAVSTRLGAATLPWTELAFARSAIGCAVAVGVALARGTPLTVESRLMTLGRSGAGTLSMLATFYVLSQPAIPLGDVSALSATSPLFIALLAPYALGERTSRGTWLASAIAFAGVVVLVRPKLEVAGHLAALAMGAALCSAVAMLFLRRLGKSESPEAVAAYFSGLAALVTLFLAWGDFRAEHVAGLPWLAGAGISAGLGQLAMTRAYALDDAARVSAFGSMGVLFTQLSAIAFVGEPATWSQALGSALILGSGLVLVLGRRWARRLSEAGVI